MLFARKERLRRRYELRVICLAEQLLHHYLSNAEKLATLCAIFLGFAADQLLDSAADIDAGTHKASSVGRLASMSLPFLSVACIGASIFCCWGCMLLSLLSSHAALQGPQSDYCNVVDKVCFCELIAAPYDVPCRMLRSTTYFLRVRLFRYAGDLNSPLSVLFELVQYEVPRGSQVVGNMLTIRRHV
eukprot:5127074-Pleurochrysis_carterae.AAC.4